MALVFSSLDGKNSCLSGCLSIMEWESRLDSCLCGEDFAEHQERNSYVRKYEKKFPCQHHCTAQPHARGVTSAWTGPCERRETRLVL